MAAFRRRACFAAPFIVTVAACAKDKPKEPAHTFPGPTWLVSMHDMKCRANEPGPNPPPPRAIECPPGMSGRTQMTVTELADHSCALVPPGCADVRCVRPKVECPLPAGQELVQKFALVWVIEKRGDKCHAEEPDADCPPGVECNPPSPRFLPCPPGITEDKEMRIGELPDATCVIVPDGCEDARCAGEKTPCPK